MWWPLFDLLEGPLTVGRDGVTRGAVRLPVRMKTNSIGLTPADVQKIKNNPACRFFMPSVKYEPRRTFISKISARQLEDEGYTKVQSPNQTVLRFLRNEDCFEALCARWRAWQNDDGVMTGCWIVNRNTQDDYEDDEYGDDDGEAFAA